jgi:hypothetical protein
VSFHRVAKYERTIHTETGVTKELVSFNQAQADEVGGVLEHDGLDIVLAHKLCEKWTRMGRYKYIQYSYRIPLSGGKS